MIKDSCIVTGGSGFIGNHLVEFLLRSKRYNNIYILDTKSPQINDSSIKFIHCDIRTPIVIHIPEYCGTCYHLAALCKEPGYDWDEYYVTNHVGTRHVCDFSDKLGVNNIIFTSTMMVFRASDERNHEEAITAPDTAYGMSKLLAEQVLQEWLARSKDRRMRIVRPGVVFGRGESANYTRLYYALKKRRFAYIGRKETVKGSIYVKDLVGFLDFVTRDDNSRVVYNFVYPESITIEEVCRTMCEVFGFSCRIPVVPYRLALIGGYFFEILAGVGIKTSIHHRRIQKLYYSTNVSADPAKESGYKLAYSLKEAFNDWKKDCLPQDLY